MTLSVKVLLEKARSLSAEERQELAELLIETLEPSRETDLAWCEKADRRWKDHVASGEQEVDAFEALAAARASLRPGRAP